MDGEISCRAPLSNETATLPSRSFLRFFLSQPWFIGLSWFSAQMETKRCHLIKSQSSVNRKDYLIPFLSNLSGTMLEKSTSLRLARFFVSFFIEWKNEKRQRALDWQDFLWACSDGNGGIYRMKKWKMKILKILPESMVSWPLDGFCLSRLIIDWELRPKLYFITYFTINKFQMETNDRHITVSQSSNS